MSRTARGATSLRHSLFAAIAIACAGCASSRAPHHEHEGEAHHHHHPHDHSALVIGPEEGDELWRFPSSETELGGGASVRFKVDYTTVPYASMTVMTEHLAATGIPVHMHLYEDEILYVLSGEGSAVVGEGREMIALEPGSLVYIPKGQWHGAVNADPDNPMEILIVTNSSGEHGLADFFRRIGVQPGHPPLNLPPDEFFALFEQYGMKIPTE
jgi:quercetin dioxygenase-like cupin family protein